MSRMTTAVSSAALLTAVVLTVAGCGSSGGSSASTNTGGGRTTAAATAAPASSAGGSDSDSGGGSSNTSCSHGLQPSVTGVVDVECGGPATIHITAGSVSASITGGTCRQAGTTWTVTAGVITQYGVYNGPPVNVVSVAATVGKDASIQGELSGKLLLVGGASFTLSANAKSAHLAGTAGRNSDIANSPVTVDVTC